MRSRTETWLEAMFATLVMCFGAFEAVYVWIADSPTPELYDIVFAWVTAMGAYHLYRVVKEDLKGGQKK